MVEYKGKGMYGKLIPYIGTIKLLDNPIVVPIKNKDKTPMMVMNSEGVLEQKKIVYKFDNVVVRDRSQAKKKISKKNKQETTETEATESSVHTLAV